MVCYARREEATLVTPPLHAPPLQLLWPRKYAPTQISHSYLRDLRAVQRSNVYDNLWRGKWLRPSATFCNFFVNTTGGLIVIAVKLCQEGSREPLVQRRVLNALFEWKSLFTPRLFVVNHRDRHASLQPIRIDIFRSI